jgi:chitinase
MRLGIFHEDPVTAMQVYSIPAFLLTQAVESMELAKGIGETVTKDETVDLVMKVLTAVFSVVPFLRSIGAGLAGLTSLAKVIAYGGFVGSAGLSVAEAVDNPMMAPLAITGILLGAIPGGRGAAQGASQGGKLTSRDWGDLAKLRGAMSADVVKGLGKSFSKNDVTLQRIGKMCARR